MLAITILFQLVVFQIVKRRRGEQIAYAFLQLFIAFQDVIGINNIINIEILLFYSYNVALTYFIEGF